VAAVKIDVAAQQHQIAKMEKERADKDATAAKEKHEAGKKLESLATKSKELEKVLADMSGKLTIGEVAFQVHRAVVQKLRPAATARQSLALLLPKLDQPEKARLVELLAAANNDSPDHPKWSSDDLVTVIGDMKELRFAVAHVVEDKVGEAQLRAATQMVGKCLDAASGKDYSRLIALLVFLRTGNPSLFQWTG